MLHTPSSRGPLGTRNPQLLLLAFWPRSWSRQTKAMATVTPPLGTCLYNRSFILVDPPNTASLVESCAQESHGGLSLETCKVDIPAKVLAGRQILVQPLPQSTAPPRSMMAGGGALFWCFQTTGSGLCLSSINSPLAQSASPKLGSQEL